MAPAITSTTTLWLPGLRITPTRSSTKTRPRKPPRNLWFVELVTYQYLMPTRYTLDVDLKDDINVTALKETKKRFKEMFKTGKNRWFFTKLMF
ncbi:hypothetical protein UlMin_022947 [Ulmus minor]